MVVGDYVPLMPSLLEQVGRLVNKITWVPTFRAPGDNYQTEWPNWHVPAVATPDPANPKHCLSVVPKPGKLTNIPDPTSAGRGRVLKVTLSDGDLAYNNKGHGSPGKDDCGAVRP